jgi:molybdenum cofactor synthesis domain-containing protein
VAIRAHVITVSDRSYAGVMEDRSGPAVAEALARAGCEVGQPLVLPDDHRMIAEALIAAAHAGFDLVLTTGGTGLAERDLTPEATASVIERVVPGLAEHIRRVGAESTPLAILSRGVAGVRARTLMVNLPGSERGARESVIAILPVLKHAVALLSGENAH